MSFEVLHFSFLLSFFFFFLSICLYLEKPEVSFSLPFYFLCTLYPESKVKLAAKESFLVFLLSSRI